MDPVKIYIIDDHHLFIEGLYALLSEEECLEITGCSTDPNDFLENLNQIEADVFLVDINMPEMTGIALSKLIINKRPEARILALTMYNDYRHIEKMIKSGALGYSLKSDNIKELIKAIKSVARGKKFISESIQETVVSKIGTIHRIEETEDIRRSSLTKREVEILMLIIKEFSNKKIAEKLFISERTVETHRKNIFAKTNTNSAISLLKHCIKEGIIHV
ncbi:MAG: DNA-binding response regulator [Bacteroidetes bacterium]|nr:MAG: DNA-binding response regulator [Bacteroidota bacterium]